VCIFYGGNVAERAELALDLGLQKDRAVSCEEKFELAQDSWGPVLDEMSQLDGKMRLATSVDGIRYVSLSEEIEFLNQRIKFPQDLIVMIEACGEANAFYDPSRQTITMCTEFESYFLKRQLDL